MDAAEFVRIKVQLLMLVLSVTLVSGLVPELSLTGREFPMEEYCDAEMFTARCNDDEVVVVTAAQFGRFDIAKCIAKDWGQGSLGCGSDVTLDMDALCSGRHYCDVKVSRELFPDKKPCPNDFLSHLRIAYKCVKVYIPVTTCHAGSHDGATVLRDSSQISATRPTEGYLSSVVTRETGCGTTDIPWVVEVSQGQVIRLTLFDFELNSTVRQQPARREPPALCVVYASIKDGRAPLRSSTVCGRSHPRERLVYTSTTNRVEIRIMQIQAPVFIVKYEAVGCPLPPKPSNGWARPLGDNTVIMGCDDDKDAFKWKLECDGNYWKGHHGNCSYDGKAAGSLLMAEKSLPHALSIVVVIAIAFVVSCIILVAGICFYRRRQNLSQSRRPPAELFTEDGLRRVVEKSPGKSAKYSAVSGLQENSYSGTGYTQGVGLGVREKPGMSGHYPYQPGSSMESGYPAGGYYPTSEHVYECPDSLHTYNGTDSESASRQYYDLDPGTHPEGGRSGSHAHAHRERERAPLCAHDGRCTCAGRQGNVSNMAALARNNNQDFPPAGKSGNSQSF